jgi:(2S)-methylsuccinyl-CoA dehydrogenase
MALDARTPAAALLDDILTLATDALPEVEALFAAARESLRVMVTQGGKISSAALEEHQFAAHALSWLATYVEALRQMQAGRGGCSRTAVLAKWKGCCCRSRSANI